MNKDRTTDKELLETANHIMSFSSIDFVIEKANELIKIKDNAKVTLANGNSFTAKELEHGHSIKGKHITPSIMFRDEYGFWETYTIFELKNAIVRNI